MKNKTLIKFLSTFLAVAMVIGSAPLSGFVGLKLPDWLDFSKIFGVEAEATTYSGTCGTNVKWSLDTSTGVLNITGTGAMKDYTYSSAPWYNYRSSIKTVNIADAVATIGSHAFYDYNSLTSVTIGDSVTSIGYYAFYDCDRLTSVTIGDSVTSIGSYAFYGCDRLTSITIPDSVTSIGEGAFNNCTSLKSMVIGKGVESLVVDTIISLTSITSFTVDENNKFYSSDKYGVLYNKDKTELIRYPSENKRSAFIIPDSVTSIGSYAFAYCDNLTSVTIGDSVTNIGSYAFYGCSLTSVTIPDSVTNISERAFMYCMSLTSITIGDSVTSIGSYAFADCDRLTSVTIPDSVTRIGKYAFYHCDRLTSVTIPDSVTRISSYAFYSCGSLASITIPDSVTSIGEWAFLCCNSLTDVYYTGTEAQWKKISIESSNDLTNATIHFESSMPIFSEYSQSHVVDDFAKKNDKYQSEYFGGAGTPLDGTGGTVDLCVPGLSENDNLVPQGITYYPAKDWMLVSAYYKEESGNMCDVSSVIFALDMSTGEIAGEYIIKNYDGTPHTGHVGGIAVSDYNLYITLGGAKIGYVPLSELEATSKEIKICGEVSLEDDLGKASASYLNISGDTIITGNFYYEKEDKYNTPAKQANSVIIHNVLYGDNSEDEWLNFAKTDVRLCLKVTDDIDRIQGVALKDGKWFISSSYGRKKDSALFICDADASNTLQCSLNYYALPMMEGITFAGNSLFALFESGAWYYNGYDSGNISKNPTDVLWRIDYKELIGEDTAISTTGDVEKTTVTFEQGSGDNKVTGSVDVSFKQNWFSEDSLTYNHSLARLCSQFVMLGYDNKKKDDTFSTMYQYTKPNLKNALETIGMSGIEILPDAGKDHVNYFIANRKITVDSKEYDLIFVGLIGSYHEQWYSNFDPGTGEIHQGFLSAKESVKVQLEHYIEYYGFSKDTTKILITGHSRGAAASNLLAADLISSETYATKGNIYTYAFATPNSTRDKEERTKPEYDRIYNIVNPEDFVTKCMPAAWDYGRYGQTFVLPSKSNEKISDYKVYKSNMQKYFSYFTDGKTYLPYMLAEADTRSVVMALTSAVHNVNQFYNKPLLAGVVPMSAHMFFQNSLCHFVSNVASTGDMATAVSIILGVLGYATSSLAYREIVDYFLLNGTELNPRFEHAHMAETYCAYMMSMTESQLKEERKGYLNTVNCPVDVTVIDNETGEVVGKIVNNVIDEEIAAKENSVVMTVDGDSKSFWLPYNGDYEVILTGNDNGTMDYTVSEVERVNFYDVEIVDGKSYTGEIISEDFVIEEYTITTDDNGVVSPDENLSDDGLQTLDIDISVVGDGYATESMTVTKGDYVSLSAVAEETGGFIGWYENGELVSTEETYSFVAKENKEITAEFMEIPCEMSGSISAADGATVTLRLLKDSEEVLTISPTDGVYNLKGVEDGTYTLEVSAENHATREYTVTIGDETVNLDIQLNLIGDINDDGKITVLDYNQVLKHVKKTGNLDGYKFACADVDGNGKVTVVDYNKILRHVKKIDTLW